MVKHMFCKYGEQKKMNWKQQLRQMKLEHIKRTAPNFFTESGGYQQKTKSYRDDNANGLTRAIIDWINFKGGSATRISSQGQARIIDGKATWTHGNTRKGVADIHAVYQGRHISIEIKIGRDPISEHQIKEKQRIESAGGLYFIAKD